MKRTTTVNACYWWMQTCHNPFNKLNRKISLENIKRLCPPTYTYCTYTTAKTHLPCFIWKIGTTYCHRRVWRKGQSMQLWQCYVCPIHTTIGTSIEQ